MALIPHYTQPDNAPAIPGAGTATLACACGSVLVSGYLPENFLNIAIQCAACGQVTETPGLLPDAPLPRSLIVAERGQNNPSSVAVGTTLISREEVERLQALCEPRPTAEHTHVISEALLDDVERQQAYWTGEPIDQAVRSYHEHPLVWAVGYFRDRLKDPAWVTFNADLDVLAVTVIAAFRDLIASWGQHPQFRAMVRTAAAEGYSFHALAMFGAAKALVASGNRIGFVTSDGLAPRIVSLQVVAGAQEQLSVAVNRFTRFEWPNGANATLPVLQAEVIEAMASVQGSINRLRPGMLVLSGGASEGMFDQLLADGIAAAVRSHGKRYRGLAAVSAIMPKVRLTGAPREARFGYSFYPVANGHHSVGQAVKVGAREG